MHRAAALLLVVAGCSSAEPIRAERTPHRLVAERRALAIEERGMMVHEVEPDFQPRIECEVGRRRECFPGGMGPFGPGHGGPYASCVPLADGSRVWSRSSCNTPLVIAFDDAPIVFTQPAADFHIGLADRTEWVSAATPWLAIDRDGNGCIDSERELFAGFDALARLDANLDGRINRRDPAFGELVLWSDRDQNKRCSLDELTPLGFPIDLEHTARGHAAIGSFEGETAALPTRSGRVVDVYVGAL